MNCESARAIGNACLNHPSLTELNISDNSISVDAEGRFSESGILALCVGFRSNSKIIRLDMKGCSLGNEEVVILSKSFNLMLCLTRVDLKQ